MGGLLSNEPPPPPPPPRIIVHSRGFNYDDYLNDALRRSFVTSNVETRVVNRVNDRPQNVAPTPPRAVQNLSIIRTQSSVPSRNTSRPNNELYSHQQSLLNKANRIFIQQYKWNSIDSEVCCTVLLRNSSEYIQIQSLFNRTTNKNNHVITKIQRVENPFLMGRYMLKKHEMNKRHGSVNEEMLFHGTKAVNVDSICKDNFNWRLCGAGTGHRFGKGVSFSPKSYYSSHYCDKNSHSKVMLVAKVLISKECIGNGGMVLPGYYNQRRKIRYDTSIKSNRDVIVKYSDDEYYPAYIINFNANNLRPVKTPKVTTYQPNYYDYEDYEDYFDYTDYY